jgi:hypothetical protein
MNCRKVEELLPLYIGGDLDEKRARLMTEHVQACIECSRSAQEYAEASQLLQVFEPPQFEEATFAAIRSQVLREIEIGRESSSSRQFQLLVRPFQPRIMWAVSTAVLLAVCLFAYYFIASRTSGKQGVPQWAENRGLQAPPSYINPSPTGSAGASPAKTTVPQESRSNFKSQTAWHSRRGRRTPAVPAKSVPNFPKLEGAGPTTLATTDKALRLEIQTSDQNIRIIWFSHPSNNEGSPKEFSKGI